MNAATSPPANAAPTRISGRSGGMPNGSSVFSSGAAPGGGVGVGATTVTAGGRARAGPARGRGGGAGWARRRSRRASAPATGPPSSGCGGRRSFGRVLPEGAAPDDGRELRGRHGGQRPDAGEQPGPDQPFDDVVVHGQGS